MPLPKAVSVSVSRLGDIWQLGRYRLLCGSAPEQASFEVLMRGELARMAFQDAPYNVADRRRIQTE